MSTSAVLPACPITSSAAECYAASWYLIADQIRYWALFQVPILALSVIYEWLELSNNPRLEHLRTFFDAPVIQVANCIFQIITCIYVCVAWIVRGGALAVSFSSWSIESFLLIITAIGYGVRWVAAKHKVLYTLKLHSLLDLLSLISHFTISFQTYAVDGQLRRSWLDFGFLRVYILYIVIDHLFTRYPHKTFFSQVSLVVFKAWCLVFFAACVLFSLERLGDLPYTDSFLLHVYKCTSAADSTYILVNNVSQAIDQAYGDCSETWSFFSSIYFMFVTVSTVGYGDFSPKTVLGQLMVCGIIVIGIYTFAHESAALLRIYADRKGGVVKYNGSRNTAHVVVTGNPSAAQVKDFIREFFHPDHDAQFENGGGRRRRGRSGAEGTEGGDEGDDHDTLEDGRRHVAGQSEEELAGKWRQRQGGVRETHLVVLMRFDDDAGEDGGGADGGGGGGGDGGGGDDAAASFLDQITQFVAENPRYHRRVFLLYGSPLQAKDLAHANVDQALAVFFLPNKFASDGDREDAATVLRVLSVSQQVDQETTPLFAMLVNAENRTLLEASGLQSDHLVCADELRLGLMGLSCRCPGLSTLVSNLITSRSADLPPVAVPHWVKEYVTGAANEIYSCELAPWLQDLTFTQCAQRLHRQSDGQVLLLAVEFERRIVVNPGHRFRVPLKCRAFLVAESRTALEPFTTTPGGSNTDSNTSSITTTSARPSMTLKTKTPLPPMAASARIQRRLIAKARQAQHAVERRVPQAVRDHVTRCGVASLASFRVPALHRHPPPSLLARGGHVVVCSHTEGSRSIARLVSFLRPLRAAHSLPLAPIVIVDAAQMDPVAWLQLSALGGVYHVHGSPQKHHVLVEAGVAVAAAVVVLAQGTASRGYDDSKAIFNAILVNQALVHRDAASFTLIELRDGRNNRFLDPVLPRVSGGMTASTLATLGEELRSGGGAAPSVKSSRMSSVSRVSTGTTNHRGRATSSVMSRQPTWWEAQRRQLERSAFFLREFFVGSLHTATARMHLRVGIGLGRPAAEDDATETAAVPIESVLASIDDSDTFFQERFMRGALFPSAVADDLLLQSFFNPSLNEFVRKMLDGTSCFMLYSLPQPWRRGTQTYGELFDYFTAGIASALPLGLLRAKGGDSNAPSAYVYTSPPRDTLLNPDDKVFVVLDVESLHRVATKLQRRFRRRRQPTQM